MKSNYKRLGDYIREVNNRNTDLRDIKLLGVSIQKVLMPSIANIIGTNMSTYKLIKKGQFAYGPVTSRNGDKISIALLEEYEEALISQAYVSFEVIDKKKLLPEYLMMWFRRPEFDRYARFMSHGSAREIFGWEEMCNTTLPIPSISKQMEIVKEYNVLKNRIKLNSRLIEKLEETAQAIYKQWFVDFEFPDKKGNPYKSNGGEMEYHQEMEKEIPSGWKLGCIGDYSEVKSGFAFKSAWWQSSGIPVLKIGSIQNNTINYNQVSFVNEDRLDYASNYLVNRGDIVIAMTGATIGKIAIVPELSENLLINQRVGMFDLGSKPLDKSAFLYFTLLQDYVNYEITNIGGDSAQENISSAEIDNIKLLLPEISHINNFNEIGKPLLDLMLSKVKENNLLEKIKNNLLSKLTTMGESK